MGSCPGGSAECAERTENYDVGNGQKFYDRKPADNLTVVETSCCPTKKRPICHGLNDEYRAQDGDRVGGEPRPERDRKQEQMEYIDERGGGQDTNPIVAGLRLIADLA